MDVTIATIAEPIQYYIAARFNGLSDLGTRVETASDRVTPIDTLLNRLYKSVRWLSLAPASALARLPASRAFAGPGGRRANHAPNETPRWSPCCRP